MLEVLSAGALTTVQDLGRPGWAHLGIARSGAADRGALRLANRLVGNPAGAAALELTLRGPRLRAHASCRAVLTGGIAAARLEGVDVAINAPFELEAGQVLEIGPVRAGLRAYLGLAGGIDAPESFGSRATDTLGRIGPEPLGSDDQIRLLPPAGPAPTLAAVPARTPASEIEVALLLGPREEWIAERSRAALPGGTYTVTPQSDRVGVRLQGPPLAWAREDELRSEGIVPGAVQVPRSGQPVILLADCPTSGGYPVIGVVPERDLDRIAQLRPGGRLSFRPRPPA